MLLTPIKPTSCGVYNLSSDATLLLQAPLTSPLPLGKYNPYMLYALRYILYLVSNTHTYTHTHTHTLPLVSLIAPASVSCEDLLIDPTGSSGFAGRDWGNITWSVKSLGTTGIAENAAAFMIQSYLNTHHTDTSTIATVPNSLLASSSSYKIDLELGNFLGMYAKGGVTVTVSPEALPSIRLYNPNAQVGVCMCMFMCMCMSMCMCNPTP
jgi:hypothetical protein